MEGILGSATVALELPAALSLERTILYLSISFGIGLLLIWIGNDLRHWFGFLRRRAELQHEGRLEEVEALLKRQRSSLRPWERLFRGLFFPGGLETLSALFLFETGRSEEALPLAETAVRKSRRHGRLSEQALTVKGLVLLQMARYPEAQAVAGLLRGAAADSLLGWIAFYQGRFEEALASLRRIPPGPKSNVARSLISTMLRLKGQYREALETLLDRTSDFSVFYTPEALQRIQGTADGRAYLEAQEKLWAGVVEPARFHHSAYIYLDQGDKEGLRFSLEKAEPLMGGNPVIRRSQQELRACLSGMTGDVEGMERSIREARAILGGHPKRASVVEFHRNAGRAELLVGRPGPAVTHLEASLQAALHPLEKHLSAYWLGRAVEAAGSLSRAKEIYRQVSSDGISSWLARDASARQGG